MRLDVFVQGAHVEYHTIVLTKLGRFPTTRKHVLNKSYIQVRELTPWFHVILGMIKEILRKGGSDRVSEKRLMKVELVLKK